MSIDYENMTYQVLADCKRSEKLDYASYWQAMLEAEIPLELLSKNGIGQWIQAGSEVVMNTIYRKIPLPIMVPLDFYDYLDIERKWIVDTRTNEKCFIASMDTAFALYVKYQTDGHWITFADLQKHFTRLDGSRFEKEVQHD